MKAPDKDILFMKRALALAGKARGMTSPNPMVGAVIVKHGKIISEAYHQKPGTPHAEALALMQAGGRAKDATVYVTLEPCCHTDKRTPPCTSALINAGVKKVRIAMRDPNPKVSGKGIDLLKRKGIEVVEGILEDKAASLNEAYVKFIKTKTPFVTLKVAMTLDGKIATSEGESKWITGEPARKVVHKMRSEVDAILSASGTVIADNPEFTSRIKGGRSPKRVIIDPELTIPSSYSIFTTPPETILVAKGSSDQERKRAVLERGVQLIEYKSGRVDLQWLMKQLGEREITSVMIEGGASLNASAFKEGIVDKVVFFVAPKILGGKDALPAIGGECVKSLNCAYRIMDMSVKQVGDDLMVQGYISTNSRSNPRQ